MRGRRAVLLHAAIEGRPFAARHDSIGASLAGTSNQAQRMLVLTGATRTDAPAQAAMDMLLVAWHAGFGYITPTVLAPRVAIGTGVTLTQAIASGFASGPSHVGAALEAMQWLAALAQSVPGGTGAPPAALDAAGRAAIDATLDAKRTLYGFGHPLFVADPRPPHMRARFAAQGFDGAYVTLFDACAQADARRSLRPNIDFLTAATLLELGVATPSWASASGAARIAAMAAHAVERRRRPAFGVNSATARRCWPPCRSAGQNPHPSAPAKGPSCCSRTCARRTTTIASPPKRSNRGTCCSSAASASSHAG